MYLPKASREENPDKRQHLRSSLEHFHLQHEILFCGNILLLFWSRNTSRCKGHSSSGRKVGNGLLTSDLCGESRGGRELIVLQVRRSTAELQASVSSLNTISLAFLVTKAICLCQETNSLQNIKI